LGDGCEIDSLNAQADSVKMTDHFRRDQIIVNEQEKRWVWCAMQGGTQFRVVMIREFPA
jgi:hypothetical protein